ncbi:response regulator [Nitrospira sp. Nam74]
MTEPARRRSVHGVSHSLLVDDDAALLDASPGPWRSGSAISVSILAILVRQHWTWPSVRSTTIVDVNMPNMDGLQFLAEVKLVQPETPVFMISAHPNPTMMAQAFQGGAADFIPKPFE